MLQLHHPQVALGLVVIERHAGVVQRPQHLLAMGIQPGQQPGRGRPARPSSASVGGRWGWVGRLPVGDEPLIPGVQPGPGLVVDPTGTHPTGPVGDQLGVDQQLGHARRPALPSFVGDRVELAEQMRAAQRVVDIPVAPVRRPAVVDRHPRELWQHPDLIHRHLPPSGIHAEQRKQAGGGRVDPMQPARHPGAGLIKVGHRCGRQPRAHDLDKPLQPGRALGQHGGQGAGRHRRAEHIGQQLRGPVHRQVLVHTQVTHQRPQPGPVAGGRPGVLREAASGPRATCAAAPLGPMLHNPQAKRRQVEHLPGLDPHHRRIGKLRAASAAPVSQVLDDLVGLGDLGQVGAGGARLLARPAPFGPLTSPLLSPRGLAQAVRGRRPGGVRGVLAEPALQLGHPRLQRGDQAGLLGVGRAQLRDDRSLDRDGGFQIRIRGRDRGLHDNEPASPLACGPYGTATHKPQTVSSLTARRRVLNSYSPRINHGRSSTMRSSYRPTR